MRWAWAQSVKLRAGRLVTAVMSPVGSELYEFQGGAELLDDGVRQLFGHAVGHPLRERVGRIGFGVAQVAAQHLAEDCDLVGGAERFGAGELVDPVVVAVLGEARGGDRGDVRRVDDSGPASGERGVHDLIGRDHSPPS